MCSAPAVTLNPREGKASLCPALRHPVTFTSQVCSREATKGGTKRSYLCECFLSPLLPVNRNTKAPSESDAFQSKLKAVVCVPFQNQVLLQKDRARLFSAIFKEHLFFQGMLKNIYLMKQQITLDDRNPQPAALLNLQSRPFGDRDCKPWLGFVPHVTCS